MGHKSLLASAVLMISPLAAQAVESDYVFDSVTAIKTRPSSIAVTGILLGDSNPTTINSPSTTEHCDRLYNLALSNPGVYTLTITIDVSFVPPPPPSTGAPVQVTTFVGCNLERKP